MRKQTLNFDKWDVSLPSINAFSFSEEKIKDWITSKSNFPLVLDINIISGCNVNCVYCSTEGGKKDVRWNPDDSTGYMSDVDLKELSMQFSDLGGETIFLCSNGEPLLNKRRFLDLATYARNQGLNVITYTNGSTLTSDFIKELNNLDVNLVIKWESLNENINELAILNTSSKRKQSFNGFDYELFNGVSVPKNILETFDLYSNRENLAIETMITKINYNDILSLRRFVFDNFDVAQFLKQTYNIGHANSDLAVQVSEQELENINSEIISFDKSRGFSYPSFLTSDHYSYDSRRLMNNLVNDDGFPFRVFLHEVGGVYHSAGVVSERFGYGTNNILYLKKDGVVDFKGQINSIAEKVK